MLRKRLKDTEQNWRFVLITDPILARKILAARDALIKNEPMEAYHHLYSIASPTFDQVDPWEELEKVAKTGQEPKQTLVYDDKGTWYVIPRELKRTFFTELEQGEDDGEKFTEIFLQYKLKSFLDPDGYIPNAISGPPPLDAQMYAACAKDSWSLVQWIDNKWVWYNQAMNELEPELHIPMPFFELIS